MKKSDKIIAYLLAFITLFVCFERISYANSSNGEIIEEMISSPKEFLDKLKSDAKMREVDVKGADGIIIPRLYV